MLNPAVLEIQDISKENLEYIQNFLNHNDIKYKKFESIHEATINYMADSALRHYYSNGYDNDEYDESLYSKDENEDKFVSSNIDWVTKEISDDYVLKYAGSEVINNKVFRIMTKMNERITC